jgi:hypothetical protein
MTSTMLQKIARSFTRLGWIGFWVQAVLMIIPLSVLGYLLMGKVVSSDATIGIRDYLALFGLAVLGFTMFWSYRYTRLGRRIADPQRCPSRSSIIKNLWIGLWAGSVGIVVSLLLMIAEVLRLLWLFMKAPQGGVPVMQTQIEDRATWVSALDVVSLLAELCTLVGELLVVGLTLWLLYRVVESAHAFDHPAP